LRATSKKNKNTVIEIYSEKVGKPIKVTINPELAEKEKLRRIIGLSNSVTTG